MSDPRTVKPRPTTPPSVDHRGGLAAARRLYLHYHSLGQEAVAADFARVIAWYERACDELDRLRAEREASCG